MQEIWGIVVEMSLYLRGVQIFCEGSILVKCNILHGGLRGGIYFLIFEHLYMVSRWG